MGAVGWDNVKYIGVEHPLMRDGEFVVEPERISDEAIEEAEDRGIVLQVL